MNGLRAHVLSRPPGTLALCRWVPSDLRFVLSRALHVSRRPGAALRVPAGTSSDIGGSPVTDRAVRRKLVD